MLTNILHNRYFARPPEVQRMLGRLLKAAINDVTDQDSHDRALLYYRLLSADVHVAKSVLAAPEEPTNIDFTELRATDPRRAELLEVRVCVTMHLSVPLSIFLSALLTQTNPLPSTNTCT